MKKKIFSAKLNKVEALGVPVKMKDLDHLEIIINGVDIFEIIDFEEIVINLVREEKKPPQLG